MKELSIVSSKVLRTLGGKATPLCNPYDSGAKYHGDLDKSMTEEYLIEEDVDIQVLTEDVAPTEEIEEEIFAPTVTKNVSQNLKSATRPTKKIKTNDEEKAINKMRIENLAHQKTLFELNIEALKVENELKQKNLELKAKLLLTKIQVAEAKLRAVNEV